MVYLNAPVLDTLLGAMPRHQSTCHRKESSPTQAQSDGGRRLATMVLDHSLRRGRFRTVACMLVLLVSCLFVLLKSPPASLSKRPAPTFAAVPNWPRVGSDLNPTFADISGLHVDVDDSIWIIQRYRMRTNKHKLPPVLHFSADGELLDAWGGPSASHDCNR